MDARKLAAIIAESVEKAAAPEPPELMDMRGVCYALSVSRATGFRMLKNGILRPVHLPGTRATRFRRADVLALANGDGGCRPYQKSASAT